MVNMTDTPNNNPEEVAGQQTQVEAQAAPPPEAQAAAQPETPAEQAAEAQPKPKEDEASAAKKEPKGKKKQKRHPIRSLLRILIALIIIAGGIYLILFLVAYFAKYESIPAMLASMRVELDLMWQRIRG